MIRVGSLFSGIGGIELGLERTGGFETVWQVEKDDYCRRVLAKHWPDVNRYEDVKDVGSDELREVDLICGGFPCQDVASAGTYEGLDGDRSGLWYEMQRCVRELEPRYVVVENVADLLANGLGTVLGELAEIGYDAEWNCLPAGAFGAPHRRDRVFVVAYPRDESDVQTITDVDSVREIGYARGDDSRRAWRGKPRTHGQESPPEVLGVDDGVPEWVDRASRALGNAVVPQVAEWIGRRLIEREKPGSQVA